MPRKIVICLLLVMLVITGISCNQTNTTSGRAEISVLSKTLTTDASGGTVLLVTIKNTGPVNAELAEIAVKFYDTGKNLLDSNRDSIMNLNPGETWDFTIPCKSSLNQIASYEVTTTVGSGG